MPRKDVHYDCIYCINIVSLMRTEKKAYLSSSLFAMEFLGKLNKFQTQEFPENFKAFATPHFKIWASGMRRYEL